MPALVDHSYIHDCFAKKADDAQAACRVLKLCFASHGAAAELFRVGVQIHHSAVSTQVITINSSARKRFLLQLCDLIGCFSTFSKMC
ncbi:unnamed protein product [Caenorhabditis brenneri]